MAEWRLPIGGDWVSTSQTLEVRDKYSGEVAHRVAAASEREVSDAVSLAREAVQTPLPAYRRYEVLMKVANRLQSDEEKFVEALIAEGGKPRKASVREVRRTRETFTWSAEEAKRIAGEAMQLDAAEDGVGRWAITMRSPVGVVCAITPSNSPLNLVAHKVGPALAAGNAVVLKPPAVTPISSLLLAEALYEAGLPSGLFSVVVGSGIGDLLLEHPDIDFYNFTGSVNVGNHLRKTVGLRPSLLELGGNSPVIVHRDADLEAAAAACASKGFGAAGQACTSVQRVFAHEEVYDVFLEALRSKVTALKVGDPNEADTDIGPMISEREAERVEAWIGDALEAGANRVIGGRREGAVLWPTILTNVKRESRAFCEEVFGPLVIVESYGSLDEAFDAANGTEYGLHAAVFTRSLSVAFDAMSRLEAGGILVNEATQWRTEFVPFGGVKKSGIGREGPRYAVEAMSNVKVAMIRPDTV